MRNDDDDDDDNNSNNGTITLTEEVKTKLKTDNGNARPGVSESRVGGESFASTLIPAFKQTRK